MDARNERCITACFRRPTNFSTSQEQTLELAWESASADVTSTCEFPDANSSESSHQTVSITSKHGRQQRVDVGRASRGHQTAGPWIMRRGKKEIECVFVDKSIKHPTRAIIGETKITLPASNHFGAQRKERCHTLTEQTCFACPQIWKALPSTVY